MNCPKCGYLNPDTTTQCACGNDLTNPDETRTGSETPSRAGINERTARGFIRIAYFMGFYLCFSLVHRFFVGSPGYADRGDAALDLVDAAVFFGMALGVTLKSRTCAVILFLWNIAYLMTASQTLLELLITAVLFLGVVGTFTLHAIEREKKRLQTLNTAGAA
jgi:hypothetical protein